MPIFNSYMVRLKAYIEVLFDADHSFFNSYMVRLKHAEVEKSLRGEIIFNSYMVRLKAAATQNISTSANFQFLHGAIKRTTSFKIRSSPTIFNSYMVRLKVTAKKLQHIIKILFNSTWCD